MIRRVCYLGLLLLTSVLARPETIDGQTARRWLADPELLQIGRPMVFGQGVQAMDLVDSRTGWAVAGNTFVRFDGRHWRPDQQFDPSISFDTIRMSGPTSGWAGGARVYRTSPTLVFARYDGAAWTLVEQIVMADGTAQPYSGYVSDIETFPDGTAAALVYAHPRSLFLRYDGRVWRDQTPASWREGGITQLSMASPNEGWAAGAWQLPNTIARQPAILHLKDGAWTEEPLPALEADLMTTIVVRPNGEGWAVSFKQGGQGECDTSRILRRTGSRWTLLPGESHFNRPVRAFALVPNTDRGWASLARCTLRENVFEGQRASFDAGTFSLDPVGARFAPQAYALLNDEVQYAAAGGSFMRWSAEALPTGRVPAAAAGERYFPVTGHSLGGAFRQYYETHGLDLGDPGISDRESLALFGYPVSERFVEINPDTAELLEVQYFERARMEYHPRNRDPYRVLLGRLSAAGLNRLNPYPLPRPAEPPAAGCVRFAETGHDLCPPFRAYWERNVGLPVFGVPITQARDEQSRTDGKIYPTQYFERERLEYHAENRGTPYEVLLGLLGAEELRERGYLP